MSCRLSWMDAVETASVFGLQIKAHQVRITNKSAFGVDILYNVPCRRVRLNSRVADGVLHCRIAVGLMMPRW